MLAEGFDKRGRIGEASPVPTRDGNEGLLWSANLRYVGLRHCKWGDVIVATLYHEEGNGEIEPELARVQRIFDGRKLLSCESTAREPVGRITVRGERWRPEKDRKSVV